MPPQEINPKKIILNAHECIIYDNMKADLHGSTVKKYLYKLKYIHLIGTLYN